MENLFETNTKMIAMPHASNSLGTINPVERIAKEARQRGVFLVDGAQGAAPASGRAGAGLRFHAFSSHKMLGPTGVGVLYGRKENGPVPRRRRDDP